MRFDKTSTMSDCSIVEKGASIVGDHAKNMISGSKDRMESTVNNIAQDSSMDKDSSNVVHKVKMTADPIITVASATITKAQLDASIERISNNFDHDAVKSVMHDQNVFIKNEHRPDSFVINEDLISKTIDMKKLGSRDENPTQMVFNSHSKIGEYSLKSNGALTIFEPDKLGQLAKASDITLNRMAQSAAQGFNVSQDQRKLIAEFKGEVQRAAKLQGNLDRLTQPKRLGKQIARIYMCPLDKSETMQGYRLAQRCTAPITAGAKVARKGVNRAGFLAHKQVLKFRYMIRHGGWASRQDARRFAKFVMNKKFGAPATFFSDIARKQSVKHLERITRNASSRFGVAANKLLAENMKNKTISKGMVKRIGKEAFKQTAVGGKLNAIKQTISFPRKWLQAQIRKRLQNTFAYKVFGKLFSLKARIKARIKEFLRKLLMKLLSFVLSIVQSVLGMIIGSIAVMLPMILPMLMIFVLVVPFFIIKDQQNYACSEQWMDICGTTKVAIADWTNSHGYSYCGGKCYSGCPTYMGTTPDKPAYSQVDASTTVINVNNQEYTVRRDCSGYVSACLRIYGSLDGGNWTSYDFVSKPKESLLGFDKYENPDPTTLQAGDIIAKDGHAEIIAEITDSGTVLVWSNGCCKAVMNPDSDVDGTVLEGNYTVAWRCNGSLDKETETANNEAKIRVDDKKKEDKIDITLVC